MFFTSFEFIGFLALLFILYYLVPKRFRWGLLLIASMVFYWCANPYYLIYILFSIVTVYATGRMIQKLSDAEKAYLADNKDSLSKDEKKAYKKSCKNKKRIWMAVGLIANFGLLALTQYVKVGFLLAPMGISFYTLQATGYLMDVYRGVSKAEENILKFALFVSFFPQLIQGPISRFADLAPSLYQPQDFNKTQFIYGLERILWGFFKKLVIADRVLAGVTTIIGDLDKYHGAYVLVVMFFYTLQLYADFTGGIDITIGIAQALGITVKENFNRPYFSKSLKEYWRRWHITMCEWFRNYLFFPVSTSKWLQKLSKGVKKLLGDKAGRRIPVYIASFIVWFATGIWHGASANFLVWGLLNWFILMVAEEMEPAMEAFHAKHHWNEKLPYKVFQMFRTFILVTVLNLFDCYKTVAETIGALGSIFTTANYEIMTNGALLEIGIKPSDYLILLIGIVIMFLVSLYQEKKGSVREAIDNRSFAMKLVLWCLLFFVIVIFGTYGIGYDASQFIYNRF